MSVSPSLLGLTPLVTARLIRPADKNLQVSHMSTTALKQIHEDLAGIRKELRSLRALMEEDQDPADDVVEEVRASRKRTRASMIPHEKVEQEFGSA